MDFELLEDFLSVLEHGSILAAAEARGVSQPSLSRKIRDLEDSLGVLLLNRTSRGVSPTVYGTAFKQHAEQMLHDYRLSLDELRAIKSGVNGHIRVGMAPALSGYLPDVICQLEQARPGVTFEIVEGTYDTLPQKTLNREIDGAFTMLPPGESIEMLVQRKIADEPIVVVADAGHTALAGAVSVEALGQAGWIVMNRPRSIIDAFHHMAHALGLELPRIVLETNSLDTLKSMLRRMPLLAAVPRGAVRQEIADGSFTVLDVAGLPQVETAFIHRHGVLPPLVQALVHEMERVTAATQSDT